MKLKPAQGVAQAHRYDGLQGANFSQATLHYVLAEHHHTLRADILPRISWARFNKDKDTLLPPHLRLTPCNLLLLFLFPERNVH